MFLADLMKSMSGLESHRGIAYLAFVAAVFAPSLLVLFSLEPVTVEANVALALIVSSGVGSMLTCVLAVGVFVILAKPEAGKEFKRLGAAALVFGSILSLILQGAMAWYVLVGRTDSLFRDYVELAFTWGWFAFGALMLMSIVVDYTRKHRAAKTGPAGGA